MIRVGHRGLRSVIAAVAAVLAVAAAAHAGSATAASSTNLTAVVVDADTATEQASLVAAGLDIVEFNDRNAEVWLHGPEHTAALRGTGLRWKTLDYRDDAAAIERLRSQEAAAQAAVDAGDAEGSALPTGRVAYRTLDSIEAELESLADQHPGRVKLFELPNKSLLGRTIRGVEIGHDVARADGRPVFLLTGVHHAREWPTAELVLEFAWDVLTQDGIDARITRLLDTSKVIIVPVVNVDGYEMSRGLIHEQKRKNCRIAPTRTPTREECASPANAQSGVDPNRNYAPFWDGHGSGKDVAAENYRGEGPMSEPEIRNIVELTRHNNVTLAIHNHTPDGRLLRVPSSAEEPPPAEAVQYQALAAQLGDVLGWPAGPWPEIYYEASGVAEENAYYGAAIYGFTPELTPGFSGLERFHPPYTAVIEQYTGTGRYADSNAREMFLQGWEAAADTRYHSVITGTAAPGSLLTLSKNAAVDSSCPLNPLYPATGSGAFDGCPVPAPLVQRTTIQLEQSMVVPDGGVFAWHVSPSLRPHQYKSALIEESYALACAAPAGGTATTSVAARRGESTTVELADCR